MELPEAKEGLLFLSYYIPLLTFLSGFART